MSVLIEKLAKHTHENWSVWMQYMFSHGTDMPDGSHVIPKHKVDRWKRQLNTRYEDLSEQEKDTDRWIAKQVLTVLSIKEEPVNNDFPGSILL